VSGFLLVALNKYCVMFLFCSVLWMMFLENVFKRHPDLL